MRILLDTQILLWALDGSGRLHEEIHSLIEDRSNEVFFSAASIWEIAIKASQGRADFGVRPEEIVEAAKNVGFVKSPVSASVAVTVADLPLYHRDPFDRLLVAQALSLPAHLYTADRKLPRYSELVKLVG